MSGRRLQISGIICILFFPVLLLTAGNPPVQSDRTEALPVVIAPGLSVLGVPVTAVAVSTWENIPDKYGNGRDGMPVGDIFLLLGIDHLLKNGCEAVELVSAAEVQKLLDEWILQEPLPGGECVTENDITDFYYENQTMFMESSGKGTMLVADRKRFPGVSQEVTERLAQGEPLQKIAAEYSLPEAEMDSLLAQEDVQAMIWQCRDAVPTDDVLALSAGDYVMWYQVKITRRFLPLDDALKHRINILLKVRKLGGWEKIFGIDHDFAAAVRKDKI